MGGAGPLAFTGLDTAGLPGLAAASRQFVGPGAWALVAGGAATSPGLVDSLARFAQCVFLRRQAGAAVAGMLLGPNLGVQLAMLTPLCSVPLAFAGVAALLHGLVYIVEAQNARPR